MELAKRCQGEFDSGDRLRGRSCFLNDKVELGLPQGASVSATVEGSYQIFYSVLIDWNDVEDGFLSTVCECPRFDDGYMCKHLWATLLEMDRKGMARQVPGQGLLDLLEIDSEDNDSFNDDVDLRSRLPSSKTLAKELVRETATSLSNSATQTVFRSKTVHGKLAGKNPVPEWQRCLSMLNHSSSSSLENAGLKNQFLSKQREAWYVLDVGECVNQGSLVIQLFQREAKKNGEFGKIKPLALELCGSEIPLFSGLDDQQLLTQLTQFPSEQDYSDRYRYGYQRTMDAAVLPSAVYDSLLPRLAETGRLVWQLGCSLPVNEAEPLAWDAGPAWQLQLELLPDDKQKKWTLAGYYQRGDQICSLSEGVMAFPTGLLLMDNKLARLDAKGAIYDWLILLLQAPGPIQIPYKDRTAFLQQLWSAPALPSVKLPDNLSWEEVREAPQPSIKIHAPGQGPSSRRQKLVADVFFRYDGLELSAASTLSGAVATPEQATSKQATRILVRDRAAEAARLTELRHLGLQAPTGYYAPENDLEILQSQLARVVDTLIASGWHVEAEGKLFRTPGDFKIEVTSEIDWFELDATIDFDGVEAKLPELLAAVRKGEKYVTLGDGSRGLLPEKWLDRYARLTDLGTTDEGKVRFRPSQALLLDAMLAEQEDVSVDRNFSRFRERLRSFSGVKTKDSPKTFQGVLRDYQKEGLGWFHFLQSLRLGGCLADDMGLGKTVQVLALLEQRRTRRLKKGESRLPSLVVVPKSLIFNWIDEASRFTPRLRVADYTGLGRKERVGNLDDYHLIVTTYGTLRRDIAELKEQRFDYAILDESQAIKNATSQSAKACRLLQSEHRLALTGTPIENHLGELWSLFEFLNPGMLGRTGAFASLCKAAVPGETDSLGDLSRAIAPFMLRRTKQQVLTELPDKTEQTLYCDLLPKDRKAYNKLRDYYRAKLTKKIDQQGLNQSKIHVLEALLRLRQASCHLGLVDKEKADQPSAKLEVLLQQVKEIVAEGHKVLVFSQFTSLLAIVRKRLEKAGIVYEYLDGKTRNRKEKVERFQTDKQCPLFLISLKAGGSGLNLTAASYVFILDPWWNPAVEAQAIDRTHRIGQTRQVFAYRIIARDTVEEKVLELQKSKRDLANAIVSADESLLRNLTADDLQLILS